MPGAEIDIAVGLLAGTAAAFRRISKNETAEIKALRQSLKAAKTQLKNNPNDDKFIRQQGDLKARLKDAKRQNRNFDNNVKVARDAALGGVLAAGTSKAIRMGVEKCGGKAKSLEKNVVNASETRSAKTALPQGVPAPSAATRTDVEKLDSGARLPARTEVKTGGKSSVQDVLPKDSSAERYRQIDARSATFHRNNIKRLQTDGGSYFDETPSGNLASLFRARAELKYPNERTLDGSSHDPMHIGVVLRGVFEQNFQTPEQRENALMSFFNVAKEHKLLEGTGDDAAKLQKFKDNYGWIFQQLSGNPVAERHRKLDARLATNSRNTIKKLQAGERSYFGGTPSGNLASLFRARAELKYPNERTLDGSSHDPMHIGVVLRGVFEQNFQTPEQRENALMSFFNVAKEHKLLEGTGDDAAKLKKFKDRYGWIFQQLSGGNNG